MMVSPLLWEAARARDLAAEARGLALRSADPALIRRLRDYAAAMDARAAALGAVVDREMACSGGPGLDAAAVR
jgi:hypothetical protein